MKRPLVKDVKRILKNLVGRRWCWLDCYCYPPFKVKPYVDIWLKKDQEEISKVEQEFEKMGWVMEFNPESLTDTQYNFYVWTKEEKEKQK